MNKSVNYTLEEWNYLIFEYNKPVVIFIIFFMLLGIMGNSLVLYVYIFRMKSSTLKVFIVYLAFVDMLGCCLGVPLDMVDLTLPLMYPWNFLCKSQHLTIYYSCISSVLTLFVIAVERFNRVCRPFALQTSPFHAKRIVVGVTLVSLLVAIPACLAFRREDKQFDDGVVVHQCWSIFPAWWRVYFLLLFSLFWIFLFITFVLYFFIWKRARQHFRQLEARKHKHPKDEDDHLTHSNHETKHSSSQINMTIFGITALFVISFAPNFILNVVQPVSTIGIYAFIKILHRLWVLNCSLNPVIYGICNGEFRQEFKRLFSTEMNQKSSPNAMKKHEIELFTNRGLAQGHRCETSTEDRTNDTQ